MRAGKDGAMNDFDVLMWGLILAGGVLALLAVTARRMTPKDEEGKPNKTSLWHGVDQLCRMLLVGLAIVAVSMAGGLLRTGGQMRGDPAHLGLMLAFCGLCAVVIGPANLAALVCGAPGGAGGAGGYRKVCGSSRTWCVGDQSDLQCGGSSGDFGGRGLETAGRFAKDVASLLDRCGNFPVWRRLQPAACNVCGWGTVPVSGVGFAPAPLFPG